MRATTAVAFFLGALQATAIPTGLTSVDDYIEAESAIALEQLLCNIGADGCNAAGAAAGYVIASPSTADPDYFFTWTRDSALVFKTLTEYFASHDYDPALQKKIEEYIISQAKLQAVSNPSGGLLDGSGLGEAKFHADATQFTGAWGRPQHDGPPLRAIAGMSYAKWLIANGYPATAQEIVWPVVRNDLAYTAQYWNETGFDLWEEVKGASFFTTIAQYRALVEGSEVAAALKTTCKACDEIAPQILCFLQSYWNEDGYIVSNIETNVDRTGKDGNSILGSIHSYDPRLGCDAHTFQPCSDKALANHKAVVDTFREWPINAAAPAGTAVGVGRYIEDIYYEGNPWYLITLASAEQLYDALNVWEAQGSLTVTPTSLPFFTDLVEGVKVQEYKAGTADYEAITSAVGTYADGFVNVVSTYMQSNGSLAEQFDKATGKPLSARDLTWSYASFLTAAAARNNVRSPDFGWLAKKPKVPCHCKATTANGAYVEATKTTFPPSQTPGGDETITSSIPEPTSTVCLSRVTFNVLIETVWGDSIVVVGDIEELGNGDISQAKPLSADNYTAENPLWSFKVAVPAGASFKYHFVKVKEDGTIIEEAGPEREYEASDECNSTGETGGAWQN
ncbi:related to glucan 1,4-alpha-glucosidase [Cephalotrichum gorgonifer]|uniref:Glucoamylase n=1 Tax=Cephalotrichum gorgonifer TaxID=2041049 RepID=A0AAE8N548_9PEZI|nr:related to glucan 1,4-alpha-glucosidase [Cephalotrichum gorgonifer]